MQPDEAESSGDDAPEPLGLVATGAALRHRVAAMRDAGVSHVVTAAGPLTELANAAKRLGGAAPTARPPSPQSARPFARVPGADVRQPLGGPVASTPVQQPITTPTADRSHAMPAKKPAGAPVQANGAAVNVPSVAATDLDALGGRRAGELAGIARRVASCGDCRLCETRTQTVFSRGNPNSPLMLIGEAPGADEDAQGRPFVGRAGQLLDDILTKGMKYPPETVYIANVLKCRPPNNRNPEPEEIEACRGYLEQQIRIVDPLVIIALGRFPAQWLLQSQEPIGKLRGKLWDVAGRKVLCTYHPAYLLRNPSAKTEVWKDVQMVMDYLGRGVPLVMRGD